MDRIAALWMILLAAVGVAAIAGCCNQIPSLPWCPDCPSPIPTPFIEPTPPPAFGTIVAKFPVGPGWGSVDFKGPDMIVYVQGTAKLFRINASTGGLIDTLNLDSRLTKCWAVAWDSARGCYWATNPERERIPGNMIKIKPDGSIDWYVTFWGSSDTNWIRNYDCDVNEDYTYPPSPDASGYQIKPGNVFVSSIHFSLIKAEFDDVTSPDHYYEEWWFKSDGVPCRAVTRTGSTYWFAEWESGKIVEYKQADRRAWAEKTKRTLYYPGIRWSSLKHTRPFIWGYGVSGQTSNIYKIYIGE